MVSLAGAQQAQPIVAEIEQLQSGITALQAVMASGNPCLTSMSACVTAKGESQTLQIAYTMAANDTASILQAVLTGLQNELTELNNALAAIT